MSTVRRLIFALSFNGKNLDVLAELDIRETGSPSLKLSHATAMRAGGQEVVISYSGTAPDSDGSYVTSEHWINGGLSGRFSSNSPVDVQVTAQTHISSDNMKRMLDVKQDQLNQYYEEVVDPVTEAITCLATDSERLLSIPDGARLNAIHSWNDRNADAQSRIVCNNVHIRIV